MSEQICFKALMSLPKPQQLRMIERLRQSNRQKEDEATSKESILMDKTKSPSVDH